MTTPRAPLAALPTHDVFNMPPPIGDQDFWAGDAALRQWTSAMGADWAADRLLEAGAAFGREEVLHWSEQANRHGPELRAFDRHGMRLNAVEFHPAYHRLMDLAINNEIHNFAWRADRPAGRVCHDYKRTGLIGFEPTQELSQHIFCVFAGHRHRYHRCDVNHDLHRGQSNPEYGVIIFERLRCC